MAHQPPEPARATGKFKVGDKVQYRGYTGYISGIENGWYRVNFHDKKPNCCPHYAESELELVK